MKKKINKKLEEFTLKEVLDIALKYGKSCTSCPFYQVQYFPCNHFCDMNDRDKKLILSSIEEDVIIDE